MRVLFIVLLFSCATHTFALAQFDAVLGKIEKDIEEKGETRLIVQLRPDSVRSASAAAYVSAALAGTNAAVSAIDQRTAIVRADRAALEKLRADNSAAYIRDEPIPAALDASTVMIGARDVWSAGNDGGGVTVAILDTGIVDPNHPFLSGKIAAQACFSVEDPKAGSTSLCAANAPALPDGSRVDFTANSASGCPESIEGCAHGMHVAGIVAGNELAADHISGVAKGARIMAVQIFSRFVRPQDCFPAVAPCVLSFTSSQLRALQYVQSKVLNFNATGEGLRIVAINMSLGGGRSGAPCDRGENSGYSRRIQELRDDGVATFIASGNDGFVDGVSFPGCISSAITIGAIAKKTLTPGVAVTAIGSSDKLVMADFSNRFEDRMVSLLSFGVNIRSSVPGAQPFKLLSGTSMATPHAAGAFAVLAAAFPSASVNEIVDAMKSTGIPVEEPVSKKHLPAVQLAAAFAALKSKLGSQPTSVPAVPEASATQSTSSASAVADQRATRFIVDLPGGKARETAAAISRSQETIAKSLNISDVKVSPIGADTLAIVTNSEVDRGALQDALRGTVGDLGKVYVDKAVPTAR